MDVVSRIPFVCECGDPGCLEFVLLHSRDYTAAARKNGGEYVALPGHLPSGGYGLP